MTAGKNKPRQIYFCRGFVICCQLTVELFKPQKINIDEKKLNASLLTETAQALKLRWKVNGKREVKPFLRALDSVFRVRYDPEKEILTLGTLINVVQNYLDLAAEDESQE